MNRIPRRNFLKHAAAAGCLSGRLAAASSRIAIVTGAPNGISQSEPVRWAAGDCAGRRGSRKEMKQNERF